MPKLTALMDVVGYTVDNGRGGRDVRTAAKGDTFTVDSDEAERLRAIDGAVLDGDANVEPAPPVYDPDVEAVAKVAGITNGPDIHDNARADLLAKFGTELGGGGSSTEQVGASATDEELAAMKAGELVAYLNQHPDEVDRVAEVNDAGEQYVSVAKAVEDVRAAQA